MNATKTCMTPSTQPTPGYQRTPTILCIDDDPDITRTIELRLSSYEVDVLRNFTGMQGMWQAVQQKPDLIITDLRMPQGDGEHLLESLRRNQATAGIPVIVLSGQKGEQVENHVRRLGADSFLQKPLHYQDLINEIRMYVELRETE
ncbi:MAG: response regulator [Planctomycetes bacterium]|nr:response regulator [Planctomycetota bacterium]